MKNFGRLDIIDFDGNHINFNNKYLKYIDNNFNINCVNILLNSSGNSILSINSKNSNSFISLNSKDNNSNGLLFNTNCTESNDNALIINSNVSHLNNIKFSIGTNSSNVDCVFGENNINEGNLNSSYIFGFNYSSDYNGNNKYILSTKTNNDSGKILSSYNDSLSIYNSSNGLSFTNNGLIYNDFTNKSISSNITNDSLLKCNQNEGLFHYNDNSWIYNNDYLQNIFNKSIKDNYINVNSKYISYVENDKINNSICFEYDKKSKIEKLDNSIYLNESTSGISANLKNSTFIGDSAKNGYKVNGENVLILNSSFRIGAEGLSSNSNNITYKELSLLSSVDYNFGDIIDRVYAKTTPYQNFSSTYIEDTLNDTNCKDFYKIVDVNSNSYFNLFNISNENKLYYKSIDSYIIDIYDVNKNNIIKIFLPKNHKEGEDFYYESLLDYDLHYSIVNKGNYENISFYIRNSNGCKFKIKFSNYYISNVFQFTNKNNNQEKTFQLKNSKKYAYICSYDKKIKYPKIINFENLICDSFTLNNSNVKINYIEFEELKGFYMDLLTWYYKFGGGNYDIGPFKDDIKDDSEYFYNIIINGNAKYLKNDDNIYKINDEKYNMSIELFTEEKVKLNTLNSSKIPYNGTNFLKDTIPFYKNQTVYLIHWGCMANFCCNFSCSRADTSFLQNMKYYGIDGDGYKYFIPFCDVNDTVYNEYYPVGNETLKIKVSVTNNYNRYDTFVADFCRWEKWIYNDSIEFHPLLCLYTTKYYKDFFGYNGSLFYESLEQILKKDYNFTTTIRTETLTYMTQVFNK